MKLKIWMEIEGQMEVAGKTKLKGEALNG